MDLREAIKESHKDWQKDFSGLGLSNYASHLEFAEFALKSAIKEMLPSDEGMNIAHNSVYGDSNPAGDAEQTGFIIGFQNCREFIQSQIEDQ